ncbi:MAG: hypothetical protein GF410_01360 [Chitinivibrionales bacterium]|nr:hypothetical protein [Chitinivibrionales bacterium]
MGVRFLSFGELLWETAGEKRRPGGLSFATAAHACRLGGAAALYGRVGNDPDGDRILSLAAAYGIETSFVQRDRAHATGEATLGPAREHQGIIGYTVPRGAAAFHVHADHEIMERLAAMRFDALCFQAMSVMFPRPEETLACLLESIDVAEVFCDFNLRGRLFNRKAFECSLHHATIARCNARELTTISTILFGKLMSPKQFADAISRKFVVPLVCVRHGCESCSVYHAGEFEQVDTPADAPGDASGGGDAFNAAFLSLFCAGKPPSDSARAANRVARYAAQHTDGIPEYPPGIKSLLRA